MEGPSAEAALKGYLHAAAALIGSAPGPRIAGATRLGDVLQQRIRDCLSRLQTAELPLPDVRATTTATATVPAVLDTPDEHGLKAAAGQLALALLSRVAQLLASPPLAVLLSQGIPLLGSRDVKAIQTLSGIAAKWRLAPQIDQGLLPGTLRERQASDRGSRRFAEDVNGPGGTDSRTLEPDAQALVGIVLPPHPHHTTPKQAPANPMRPLVLPSVLATLLAALLQLSSGPAQSPWAAEVMDKFLETTPPQARFSSLLLLLSSSRNALAPCYAQPALSYLLSAQLQRPRGVRYLLSALIGAPGEITEPPLALLEATTYIVARPPRGSDTNAYFTRITTDLIEIIAPSYTQTIKDQNQAAKHTPAPESLINAASFILAHFVASGSATGSQHVLPMLHRVFQPVQITPERDSSVSVLEGRSAEAESTVVDGESLATAVSLLTTLLMNSPPSPEFSTGLITPILPALASLWWYLWSTKGDPVLRDEVRGLVSAWARVEAPADSARAIHRAVEICERKEELGSAQYHWAKDAVGGARICQRNHAQVVDQIANADFDLALDTEAVVTWLKELDVKKVSNLLLVRWLNDLDVRARYRELIHVKRNLLRLSLVTKLVDEIGPTLLEDPSGVLEFIRHGLLATLEGAEATFTEPTPPSQNLQNITTSSNPGLPNLSIVDQAHSNTSSEDDSEGARRELERVALTLLVTTLEANTTMDQLNTPVLVEITALVDDYLQRPCRSESDDNKDLALQCRMVLAVRYAASRANAMAEGSTTEAQPPKYSTKLVAARERYHEALNLLQDRVVPFRAQGLSILRSLVVSDAGGFVSGDPALVPAILDIFVRAIEEEDSFVYLNAVSGLSEMAESCGKLASHRLAEIYSRMNVEGGGRHDGAWTESELDKVLRVGEAITQVVQRAGTALPLYIDRLIGPLLAWLKEGSAPAILRSSALNLLATCAEASALALLPYSYTIVDACLTLLSLESVPLRARKADGSPRGGGTVPPEGPTNPPRPLPPWRSRIEETPEPTSASSGHPALRRSAILFLVLLYRASLGHDSFSTRSAGAVFPASLLQRCLIVLRFVAQVDEDGLVRHQAGEALEEIQPSGV